MYMQQPFYTLFYNVWNLVFRVYLWCGGVKGSGSRESSRSRRHKRRWEELEHLILLGTGCIWFFSSSWSAPVVPFCVGG